MDRSTYHEEGSTFLAVLVSIVMLTVLLTAFFGLTVQQMMYSNQLKNHEQALSNARSGYLSAYHELQTLWNAVSTNGNFPSLSVARANLLAVESTWMSWASQINTEQREFHLTIAYGPRSLSANVSSVIFDQMELKVTGYSGNMSNTLQGTVSFSGMLPSLDDVIYTPGNLNITGGPELEGNVAVGGTLYLKQNMSSALPYLAAPYSLAVGKQVDLLNEAIEVPLSVSTLPKYFAGVTQVNSFPSFSPPSVLSIIQQEAAKLTSEADVLYLGHAHEVSNSLRDRFIVSSDGVKTRSRKFTIDQPLYVQGNLIISKGTTVTFRKPIYVTGKLIVQGSLNADDAIFVNGSSDFSNLAQRGNDQGNTVRLELFSNGPIKISPSRVKRKGDESAIILHAFFASASTVSITNASGKFSLYGGIEAQNVILEAGAKQRHGVFSHDGGTTINHTRDASPSRNLVLVYDRRFVTNPVTGTSQFSTLILQPMAQPALLP